MKAVVQRVSGASVTVGGRVTGSIGFGLLVYLGVAVGDSESDADWLADKIINLRIFDDTEGKMNLSLGDLPPVQNEAAVGSIVNQSDVNSICDKVNGNLVNRCRDEVNNNNVNHTCNQVNNGMQPVNIDDNDAPTAYSAVGILTVSQFTLLGDVKKGRRPSWNNAAPPEEARKLYHYFMAKIREKGFACQCGEFQSLMRVSYINEGPVTILINSAEIRK